MEVVKKVAGHKIIKKRNGRYGVMAKGRNWVSGEEKVRVLREAGLIEAPVPQPAAEPEPEPEAAPAEEETVADADSEAGDAAGADDGEPKAE